MKHRTEMTPEEAAAALAELRRGPKPEPMRTDRRARDMSAEERIEWLREYKRKLAE
jgi:ribosomal protein L29